MTVTTNYSSMCQHCGTGHTGPCMRIKAIEYHPDGTVKRIEYHAPQPVLMPMPPRVELPKFD